MHGASAMRVLQAEDMPGMQACNLQNLPENYTMRYCEYIPKEI